MLKEFLWEAFRKTGNIEAYVFYKEIENKIESNQKSKILIEQLDIREELVANA